jgi:hypothetical protein
MEVCTRQLACLAEADLALTYLHQWSDVLVLDSSLASQLVEASAIGSISHALILQITLTALVANGAVQWMVCQQKLHDAFSCFVDQWAIRLHDHTGLDRPST